jgi:hypothetical protein
MAVGVTQAVAIVDHGGVNVRTKATVLLVVWLVAYTVLGGVVWFVSMALLPSTMPATMIAVALTIGLGWIGASWTQRRVDSAMSGRALVP